MPNHLSRRRFLLSGAAAGALTLGGSRAARAYPLGLPLGLQLYAVRELLARDYAGTLRQIAGLGYQEVEAAGFFNHSADEVKAALAAAGLRMPSAHFSPTVLQQNLDQTIALGGALGLRYIVCSFPAVRNAARLQGLSYQQQVRAFTLEDFRWTAQQLNLWGSKLAAAGMRLAYHNYTMEFVPHDGVTGFGELMRLTDPELVSFELDCGWASVGGADPAALLRRYPTRISMLHVKDFKPAQQPVTITDPPPPAELGQGTVQFRPIFEAARDAQVRHIFVEQEGFDMPPMESLRIDAQCMRSFHV